MEYPKPPPVQPLYATRILDRRPMFKYHDGIGKAKNAVGYTFSYDKVRGGTIYKWNIELNEWEVIYDIEPGSSQSQLPWRR